MKEKNRSIGQWDGQHVVYAVKCCIVDVITFVRICICICILTLTVLGHCQWRCTPPDVERLYSPLGHDSHTKD